MPRPQMIRRTLKVFVLLYVICAGISLAWALVRLIEHPLGQHIPPWGALSLLVDGIGLTAISLAVWLVHYEESQPVSARRVSDTRDGPTSLSQ